MLLAGVTDILQQCLDTITAATLGYPQIYALTGCGNVARANVLIQVEVEWQAHIDTMGIVEAFQSTKFCFDFE